MIYPNDRFPFKALKCIVKKVNGVFSTNKNSQLYVQKFILLVSASLFPKIEAMHNVPFCLCF